MPIKRKFTIHYVYWATSFSVSLLIAVCLMVGLIGFFPISLEKSGYRGFIDMHIDKSDRTLTVRDQRLCCFLIKHPFSGDVFPLCSP